MYHILRYANLCTIYYATLYIYIYILKTQIGESLILKSSWEFCPALIFSAHTHTHTHTHTLPPRTHTLQIVIIHKLRVSLAHTHQL